MKNNTDALWEKKNRNQKGNYNIQQSGNNTFEIPRSEIDKAMEQAANQDNLGVSAQIYNIAKGLIFYAVIGLIVGLIMKKKDPDAA